MTRWKRLFVVAIGCGISLNAHSAKLTITYQSDPPGAALFQNGQLMGYTPFALVYELSKQDKQAGFKLVQGTEVKWASGAFAQISSLTADIKNIGRNQVFTFQRPDVPGRDADVQVGLQMQQLAMMRQQAQASYVLAIIEQQQRFYEQQRLLLQQSLPRRVETSCTSTAIGSTVNTTCY